MHSLRVQRLTELNGLEAELTVTGEQSTSRPGTKSATEWNRGERSHRNPLKSSARKPGQSTAVGTCSAFCCVCFARQLLSSVLETYGQSEKGNEKEKEMERNYVKIEINCIASEK